MTSLINENPIKLYGTYLMVTNEYDDMFWRQAVHSMNVIDMKVIIIQTEQFLYEDGSVGIVKPSYIKAVLDEAANFGMSVFIGLALPQYGNGNPSYAQDIDFMTELVEQSKESVDRVYAEFGLCAAFVGFSLPFESWTPATSGELGHFDKYFSEVSQYCKDQADKEIAISPFVSGGATDPGLTETIYRQLLSDSAITTVILQDGVGTLGIEPHNFNEKPIPYFEAMKRVCDDTGKNLWINIEAFNTDNTPTSFDRMKQQIQVAAVVSSNLVTYEFGRHWMGDGLFGQLAQVLYDSYQQWHTTFFNYLPLIIKGS